MSELPLDAIISKQHRFGYPPGRARTHAIVRNLILAEAPHRSTILARFHWLPGRYQIRPVIASRANTAPAMNVPDGPAWLHTTPAMTLANNSATPLTRLKTPNAVPRSVAGAGRCGDGAGSKQPV